MKFNRAGIDLIRNFEGERLTPYQDVAGLWTIGIGHLIKSGEHFTSLTHAEAEELLRQDLAHVCKDVQACIAVPLNDNQFSALCSFAYNCGTGALKSSTLLKKVNAGDVAGAKLEFAKWNKAGGKIVSGLVRRRAAEAVLFDSPTAAGVSA